MRTTMKKTFFYNFFPTKMEEEEERFKSLGGTIRVARREVVEIRDIYPPPPTTAGIKKTLNPREIAYEALFVSLNNMFEYVIRYWSLEMAKELNSRSRIGVGLLDVTEEENPKKYDEVIVHLVGKGSKNEYVAISCMKLFRDRKLKVNDVISLFWDSDGNCFRVKLAAGV